MPDSKYDWKINFNSNFVLNSEVQKEIAKLEQDNQQLLDTLKEIERQKNSNEFKKDEMLDQIANEKSSNFEREKEFNDLSKQMELEKEKEIVLQSDK